jgi:hypothetical protein
MKRMKIILLSSILLLSGCASLQSNDSQYAEQIARETYGYGHTIYSVPYSGPLSSGLLSAGSYQSYNLELASIIKDANAANLNVVVTSRSSQYAAKTLIGSMDYLKNNNFNNIEILFVGRKEDFNHILEKLGNRPIKIKHGDSQKKL